ncbi:peptide-methionine (S)-S-oxide reductase MsrA [Parvularcula oceani]|uniref:peptide-methionine (S)-S-oxide reductase MsrA n=1 Tax=Parvularcula oceani TaxID=1247963 RepID=UPI00055C893E|nr:peptide-methionine (S)-S-oxide reductase MsrA [Parvularcula oceani]
MTRIHRTAPLFALLPLLAACVGGDETQDLSSQVEGVPEGAESLLVAGGCFWCVEADFEKKEAVYEVVSGYAGGETPDPTYKTYEAGGHREVARIYYDPERTDYETLVRDFLRTVDVTDAGGQFCDRGYGYTTAVYYESEAEREAARAALAEAERQLGQEVVTDLAAEPDFTAAEAYHQDYYEKNPLAYRYYRTSCGRDARLEELWGTEA